jgi:hypothetical protein
MNSVGGVGEEGHSPRKTDSPHPLTIGHIQYRYP